MSKVLQFGERMPEYAVPVLNEREARAGAGILFLVAMMAFANAWFMGNFAPTKLVVIAFFVDFFIRVFINPKYAPSLVLGRIAVRRQQPEYVGAPQKRFAWFIGFALAAFMMYLLVFQNVRGPINLLVCALCLLLLFFETAFGICIGCAVYNLFNKDQAQLCPGGVCETAERSEIQMVGLAQIVVVAAFFVGIYFAAGLVASTADVARTQSPALAAGNDQPMSKAEQERCKVPEFAIAMGHAEKWKLHNNCK
ncbi:MAG: DUF4395 domain-containing protein [Proteobacteria bacterium]|nr:DUF4395 domain-containing protein [Pseudomonadota bacterium]